MPPAARWKNIQRLYSDHFLESLSPWLCIACCPVKGSPRINPLAQLQFSNYAGPIMLGPPKVPGDCQFAVGCIFPGGSSVTAPALKNRQILHSSPEAVGYPLMWRGIVRNCPFIPPKARNPPGREPVPGSVSGVLDASHK